MCVSVCAREIECERVCLSLSVCVLVDPAKKDRCDELNFRSVARASVTTMSLETSDGVCSYTHLTFRGTATCGRRQNLCMSTSAL